MSINDATNVASATAASASSSVKKLTKSLSNNIFAKTIHQLRRKCYKSYYAKSYDQLPIDTIFELNPEIIAHYSGPDVGISDVSLVSFRRPKLNQETQIQEQQLRKENIDLSQKQLNEEQNPIELKIENHNDKTQVLVENNSLNTTNSNGISANEQKENKSKIEITEKTLINECLDSFFKSNITKWDLHHHRAYGIATSLYENNPVTQTTVGDPIADVYAILARRSSSILVLADGVNWGPRSRVAARCAVRACMNYINRNLFCPINTNNNYDQLNSNSFNTYQNKYLTTHDIFRIMCRSFDAAQDFILQKKGTMTTLCCSVVVKLKDSIASSGSSNSLWAVCTLSIGDSTAYVYNRTRGVFELTYGARNLNDDRDMRNVGGALGHVYGIKPDVSNLNYSVMYIKENDIVFLVSDGVSDNLDPCVSQTARKKANKNEIPNQILTDKDKSTVNNGLQRSFSHKFKKKCASRESICIEKKEGIDISKLEASNKFPLETSTDDQSINLTSLPIMSPYERYVCSLAHMNEILSRNKTLNDTLSAQETCAILIEHVLKITAEKREMLEKGMFDASKMSNENDKQMFQAVLRERVQKLRGKLDHASIVAYDVGNVI